MMNGKKSFLHDVLFPNFGIKILSLIGAIIVWLVIINIDDPYKTKTFQVSVETINENAIESVNKVFEITSGDVASVRVTGKRSVVDKLDATDIRATADLSDLSSVNAVAIQPSLRKKVSSDVSLECSDVLKVSLENMASKQLKITVVTEGTPADGYSVGECTAKPNIIRITGGESTISRIEAVKVFLNVDGVSEDFNSRLEPVAYDENDKAVTATTLTYSETKIKVRAKVLENKTIPVRVSVTGTPADGYEYVETECLPAEIEVAGSAKKLSGISKLEIPIDINGLTDSSSALEQTINANDYLKVDGITIPEEYEFISVKITIERKTYRQVEMPVDNIKFYNLGKNLVANVTEKNHKVTLTVSGRESVLNALPDSALVVYVDCQDKKAGSYELPVQLDLGNGCQIIDPPKVKIQISAGENAGETASTANPGPTTGNTPDQPSTSPQSSQGPTPSPAEEAEATEDPAEE